MASCTDPSSPTPSDLSILEKQKIYLNQSAYNSNFSPFLAFIPMVDEKSSIAGGQVYDPINSIVNGWPDFSMVSSTSFVGGDSDAVKEMNTNQITENIKKRKGETNAISLKVTLIIHGICHDLCDIIIFFSLFRLRTVLS